MFKELLNVYEGKHTDEELIFDFNNGKTNEVIAYIFETNKYLFHQTARSYIGVEIETVDSDLIEQIWKCLINYDSAKSKGKLTTMICTYIRNELRNITQSNNYNKRAINEASNCSLFSEFEEGEDRLEEASDLAGYDLIEMEHMVANEDLTENEKKYCLAALKNLDGLTPARIAEQIGVSRAGAKCIRQNLQYKLNYLLG